MGSTAPVIEPGDAVGGPFWSARLASAVSSTSDRRVVRLSLGRCLEDGLLMIRRLPGELFEDPTPQCPNFLRRLARLRKLRDPQSRPQRILMVVAQSDIRKGEHAERVEGCCRLAQPAASRRRLIEDVGKSAIEPWEGDQRRY